MRQFVKFGIVGASGFVVNLVIFTILQRLTALPIWIDFSIGFMTGGVYNYFLNRIWTFRSTGHAGKEGAQFLTVSFFAMLLGDAVIYVLEHVLGYHHHHTAWLLATLSGMFLNFFANKYWTFKNVA